MDILRGPAEGSYEYQDQLILFASGNAIHLWTQLRGAALKLEAMRVCWTRFTPFIVNLYTLL